MNNPSVAQDLALKKFTGTPQDQKPNYNWRDVLKDDLAVPAVEVLCPHGSERFDLAEVADTIGKSLANLLLARGEKDIFNEKNQRFVADVTSEVATNLTKQALTRAPLRVSLHDLYVLIEKTLVDNNAHDVAKSLLHKRAQKLLTADTQPAVAVKLIRRNNQVVPWNQAKVEIAIRKAFLSLKKDSAPAGGIARAITERAATLKQAFLHIEEVQDMVQEELMKSGHYKVAEDYILYRAARHAARAQESAARHAGDPVAPAPDAAPAAPPQGQNSMIVVQRPDGTTYLWDGVDLKQRIEFASIGLHLALAPDQIESELRRSTFDHIAQGDLNNTIVLNAKTLIERDAGFAKFAGRIQLTYLYEEVLGWDIIRDGVVRLKEFHQRAFAAYLDRGIAIKRLSPRLREYDLAAIAAALDPSADLELDFLGVQTLYDRYLIIDKTGKRSRRLETPQFFWMRVALGLFLDEKKDRENWAVRLYSLYKSRRFCSSTPTLFNSGTLHSQLSSCYLYYVDDSIEGIFQRGIADNAYLSKWAGGLGGSWTPVRGTGAHIAGTNGESQGVIPFLKLHNDQLVAVNQGGKRKGSGCAYLESWHNDIFEFLELRRNTGDDRRRTHDMNTANWIPDLFMKRMEARGTWTLLRSNETPDLHETYGRKFEEAYTRYEKLAEEGKIQSHKVEALELWKKMLSMLFETGHPWITFKDPCNLRSPQDHAGVIHSSNLCCMTADQRVVTAEGLLTVGELYARARRLALVGPDGNSVLTAEPVNTVFGRSGPVPAGPMLLPRPDAPIVRIITKEGFTHKVTPDHKVWVVGRGWVEAQELKRGDLIEIQQGEGLWGTDDARDLALLAGLIAGDGTFMVREGTTSVLLDLWAQEFPLIDEVEACVARVLAASGEECHTTSSRTPRFTGDEYKRRLSSAPLARILAARGFARDTKLVVPEFVWTGTRDTAAAYLRGLYAADATVEASGEVTTCSLASASREFLAQIQILLANFGIKSSLTRMREAGLATLPDGRGGEREYWQAELFRLHVTSIQGCRLLENLTGIGALRQNARYLANLEKPGYAQKMHAAFEALEPLPNEDAFCLQVFTDEHSWTVNGLVTKNTEITLNTSNDETAVCNLGSVILDSHLKPDGSLDHEKLRDTISVALRALDNVIDINFYPTEAARRSNLRHRPVGLGIMGLANALYLKGIAFASPEAVEFNDEFMEAIAYYAYEASSDLAAERGTYSTYKGSKWDRGLLPQDTLDLLESERGVPLDVPRGGKMDWAPVRAKIARHGMRNSNCLAIAPTATISNITNTSPCIEPYYKNLYVKSNLSGEFVVINTFLVEDLKARGLWNQEMIDALKYHDGDLKDIEAVPADLKEKYLTAFDVDHKWVIAAAARRQKWIDQSQSVNLWLKTPDLKTLSHMYRHAWKAGLKTTYYLRTLGASNIEKATINVKKEVRGHAGSAEPAPSSVERAGSSADVGGVPSPRDSATGEPASLPAATGKKVYSDAEKKACSIEAMKNGETCEACQ